MSNFDRFFEDPVYLFYKNHLYNYLLRQRAVRKKINKGKGRILELGCGISPMLEATDQTVQTDVSWQGLSYLKKRSRKSHRVRPVACDAGDLPFSNESFDRVVCSEVLEHIKDDRRALWEIARVTKRGGELVLTCPVRQKLFGFDDEFVGHFRRYEVPELLQELSRQGFQACQVQVVLGPLEKILSIAATRLFSLFRRKGNATPSSLGIRVLGWLFFPLYLLTNYLLVALVFLQSKLIPIEKATTVCIQCRKSN